MRVAVLDDYQNVAASCADWNSLGCEVTFINQHLGSTSQVVAALQGFEGECGPRTRATTGLLRCLIGRRGGVVSTVGAD